MRLEYANVQLKHQNAEASMPLILPVHVVCNTDDNVIFQNISANSRACSDWQQLEDEHDRVAVICGSGPSLADTLDDILELQEAGAVIFALNGAAKWLHEQGVWADYQVLLDARAETAQLVFPLVGKHLLASQVHPDTLALCPNARLWQLQVQGIDLLLPEHEEGYCQIGGAASVGNTATCLAFAMGFRKLELFGYDSCHRDGKGHAFLQKMNEGDPCAVVQFWGREYTASLTMKLQAEKFMDTSRALEAHGVTINVHGSGLLPDMWRAPRETLAERDKYERMWAIDGYRELAPGELCAEEFLALAKPHGATVIDFGCGTGRGALKIHEAGSPVIAMDFSENCLDAAAKVLPFIRHDLTEPVGLWAPYGYCTDVMEHIPTADVERVLENVLAAADTVYFQIATVEDAFGQVIGETLHLTVRPHAWWKSLLASRARVIWEAEEPYASRFLVQSLKEQPWMDSQKQKASLLTA